MIGTNYPYTSKKYGNLRQRIKISLEFQRISSFFNVVHL